MCNFMYLFHIFSPFLFPQQFNWFLGGEAMGKSFLHVQTGRRPRNTISSSAGGELAELVLVRKALSLGFEVARRYGDSEWYDFILESRDETPGRQRGRSYRMQVKLT